MYKKKNKVLRIRLTPEISKYKTHDINPQGNRRFGIYSHGGMAWFFAKKINI